MNERVRGADGACARTQRCDHSRSARMGARETWVRCSMSGFTGLVDQPTKAVAIVVAAVFSISSAAAGATCGICDTEIVINSELASCFLEQYDKLAKLDEQAIVVDLSNCTESRGIVEALP